MATVNCKARVRKNGSLALPKKARERLNLQPGDEVEISVHRPEASAKEAANNPLYGIIGIVKEGRPDGAENHDAYLYGKESE